MRHTLYGVPRDLPLILLSRSVLRVLSDCGERIAPRTPGYGVWSRSCAMEGSIILGIATGPSFSEWLLIPNFRIHWCGEYK